MKTRLFAMGLAVMSAALVACGGGGGGGNNNYTPPQNTPTPVPTVTATPTPTPTPANQFGCVGQSPYTASSARRTSSVPHPVATGDAFTYTGSLQKKYAQSAPCPQPTSTTSAQVSISVKNTAATSPSGATDVQSTETDAFPTQSITTTTDQIVQLTSSAYQMLSTASTDATGNKVATTYVKPQTLDNLPETTGTWSNDPAASVTETLADGTSVSRTLASNGTYNETYTYPNGIQNTIAVADLSGAADYHLAPGQRCNGEVDFSYGAPSGGSITLTINSFAPNKSGVCVTTTATRTFPQWFTPPAASYVSDQFSDNGAQPIPTACNVSFATNGQQIVETSNVLDPALGYTDKRVTTSYVVTGYGAVCVTIADTLNGYYDYADDTTKIDYQSQNGQPNSVDTITETIGMQTSACASGSSGPCPAARRAQSTAGVSPLIVAMRVAAIDHVRALQRATRARELRAFAKQFVHQGGVR